MEDNITPKPDDGASVEPEAQVPETNQTAVQEQNTGAEVQNAQVETGGTDTSNIEAKRRASEMYLRRENRRLKEQLSRASQIQSPPQAQQTKVSLFEDPDAFMETRDKKLVETIMQGLENRESMKMSAQKEEEARKILEQLASEGQIESVQDVLNEHPELDSLDSLSAMKIVQKMIGGVKTRQPHSLTPRKSMAGNVGSATSTVQSTGSSYSELKAKASKLQTEFGSRSRDPEFMKEWNRVQSELKKMHQS